MGNEKFNGIIDRHNSSLPLSAGEIDNNDFIESLNRLINKFWLKTFFFLPDTGKSKMIYLIRESHPHIVSSAQQEHERRWNLP